MREQVSLDEQLDTNLRLDEPLYELCSALVRRRRQAMQSLHYWIVERRPWIGSVCGGLLHFDVLCDSRCWMLVSRPKAARWSRGQASDGATVISPHCRPRGRRIWARDTQIHVLKLLQPECCSQSPQSWPQLHHVELMRAHEIRDRAVAHEGSFALEQLVEGTFHGKLRPFQRLSSVAVAPIHSPFTCCPALSRLARSRLTLARSLLPSYHASHIYRSTSRCLPRLYRANASFRLVVRIRFLPMIIRVPARYSTC